MREVGNVFLKEKMNRLLGKAGIAALTAIMVCTSGMKSNAQGVVSQNASDVEEKGYYVEIDTPKNDIISYKCQKEEPVSVTKLKSIIKGGDTVSPQGIYIREAYEYVPNYMTMDNTYKSVCYVNGDNRGGSSDLTINLEYSTSGTVTASLGGHASVSAEAGVIFAKAKTQLTVDVCYSRSWTQGTKIGASYTVKSGKYEKIEAFIPAVKTAGKIKYRVYMDSNPGNVFYEYGKDLNAMYAPVSNGIYIKSSSAK